MTGASADTPAQGRSGSARDRRGYRSFSFFVTAQFLGAFNDNAFKQLIMLLALDQKGKLGVDYQPYAMAVFAVPFLIFSGFAGALSDRFSKTRVIFCSKAAEIVIMGLGAFAFWAGSIDFLLLTLFLMGAQSAFFGPAKYGVLPEMLPKRFLASANGIIFMTTFVAIILGQAAAGWLKQNFPGELWKPQLIYIGFAVLGTAAALGMRRIAPAAPTLSIKNPMGDLWPSLRTICRDRSFLLVVAAYSFFWFVGGVMQPVLNAYGKRLLLLDDTKTGFLLVSLSSGMAAGGILGAILSRGRIEFRLTIIGGIGVAGWILALAFAHRVGLTAVHVSLILLGISGSFFGIPLQTYIQKWPPESDKGRVVAATNFVNWIFICLSAAYYFAVEQIGLPIAWMAAPLGVLSLALVIFLRPRLARLDEQAGS